MANTSIFSAFERMWQHVVVAVGKKADAEHTHTKADITDLTGAALLWSGTAVQGDTITISGVRNYKHFIIELGNGNGVLNGYNYEGHTVYAGSGIGINDAYIEGSTMIPSSVASRTIYSIKLLLSKWETTETATINTCICWTDSISDGTIVSQTGGTLKIIAIYGIV